MNRVLVIVFTFILVACNKSSEYIPDTTPQTTLMYMTGTDLSSFFSTNISSAKKAIATGCLGYGRFLVFRHSTSSAGSLIEYSYDRGSCIATTLKEYTDIKSLSQDAITRIIADTKELAPADSYNLIISGHATGWVPKTRLTTSWSLSQEQGEVIDWDAMFNASPIVTRYLGSSNDGYFDISELKASLEAADTYFETLIFDECFMSSIEALYDLRYLVGSIIASPCEIMGAGFPYDTILPELFASKGTQVDLQGICQAYYDYYESYSYPSGCVALTVCSEFDALAAITREIYSAHSADGVNIDELQAYERLSNHLFFDFEQYTAARCQDEALLERFMTQMELTFPTECRLHTERFFANIGTSASSANNYDAYFTTISYYSGVTTSVANSSMSSEWEQTAWASAVNQ